MPRSRLHAFDYMWQLTEHITWVGYMPNDDDPTQPLRDKLAEAIGIVSRDLTIEQIQQLTVVIDKAYQIGKLST